MAFIMCSTQDYRDPSDIHKIEKKSSPIWIEMRVYTYCAIEIMKSNIRISLHKNILFKKIFSLVS